MSTQRPDSETVSLCACPPSRKSGDDTRPTELELDEPIQAPDERNWLRTLANNPETISLCSHPPSRKSEKETGLTEMDLDEGTQLSDKRSWWRTLLFQTACFLWLVPVTALLILNFKKYIVGASAWCPHRDCYVGWFNPVSAVPLQNLRNFDKHSHNLLGTLQLVSKALEIWFELIVLALVYIITFLVAGRGDGLPIAYLMRPSEFSNLPGLFDPLLWRALPGVFRVKGSAGGNSYRLHIYLFIGFTVLLCLLCNLMGPATAVLAIPSLQWIDTPHVGNRTFGILNSNSRPKVDSQGPMSFTQCNEEDMASLRFACTEFPFRSQLDSWIESYIASGVYGGGESQEQGVKFRINQTFSASNSNVVTQEYSGWTWWVSNRQVLSNLNTDYVMVLAMSTLSEGYDVESLEKKLSADKIDTYAAYNSSIQLIIQRNGPVVGAILGQHMDANNIATWTSTIDDNLAIRCYGDYQIELSSLNYTRCVQVGDGWGTDNKRMAFNVSGVLDYNTGVPAPDVEVTIFASDKACFLEDGAIPSWLPSVCLEPGPIPPSVRCDWNRLFYVEVDDDLYNRTKNVVTIELYTRTNYTGIESTIRVSVDFVAFLNFTTYQLDPSPITNPANLVQTNYLPNTGEVIKVDPSWLLAAWTVDNNGSLYSSRTAAIQLVQSLDAFTPGGKGTNSSLVYAVFVPIMQALSLIVYTTEELVEDHKFDARHPILTRNARLFVWAYGFQSRTSKLGLVVALAGITVVVGQVVLGFIDRRKYRSPTQLLVAALEHAPSSEFKDVEHNEVKVASMRFHVQGTMTNAGKFSFKKMVGRTE